MTLRCAKDHTDVTNASVMMDWSWSQKEQKIPNNYIGHSTNRYLQQQIR